MRIFTIKNSKIQNLLFIAFWLLIWETAAKLINAPVILPSVEQSLTALIALAKHAEFYTDTFLSILRVFAGVGISIIIGIALGMLSGLYEMVYRFFNPVMSVVKSTPVVSFIILALVWMKTYTIPVFVCFLMCVPIIWTNVTQGIKDTDEKILQMCRAYKVRRIRVIKDVYLPSISGYVFSSIAASIGIGWKATVAAEVIARPDMSIGAKMYDSKIYLQTENLFALTLTVIVLSFIIEYVIKNLINNFSKGRKAYLDKNN